MAEDALDASRPAVRAHRGFAGTSRENTVRGVRLATTGPGSTAAIEVDVMPTGDGTVAVRYDAVVTPDFLLDSLSSIDRMFENRT